MEAWLARDKNRKLYLYKSKPRKGATQWFAPPSQQMEIDDYVFFEVQWSDYEPTRVSITIKK